MPPAQPEMYRSEGELTNLAYNLLISHPNEMHDLGEWAEILIKENPKFWNRKVLAKQISGIFSHLVKHGYARRAKFSGDIQSEALLNPEQREAVVELLTTLDNFQFQDEETLKLGRDLADEFRTNPLLY